MIDRDSLDENNVMSVCNTYVTIPSKTQCFQRLELLQALIETIQEIIWTSRYVQFSNKANKNHFGLSKVVFCCIKIFITLFFDHFIQHIQLTGSLQFVEIVSISPIECINSVFKRLVSFEAVNGCFLEVSLFVIDTDAHIFYITASGIDNLIIM